MIRLLIVDDEEDLLWALSKNLFKDRKDIKIYTASEGAEALKLLKRHSIELLIADIRISGEVDGFNLISQAKDITPRAKVIVMTAFSTDRSRQFSPTMGVVHYIEKPFDINNLRSKVTDILDEGESYRGVMSDLALADIIALLCLSKRTALLHLNHRSRRGRIEVREGELIHAEFDGMVGHEAVWTMLGLQHGDIWFATDFSPYERSVELPWEEVLSKAEAWLEENAWLVEEPVVDIPMEAWDEQDAPEPEPDPEPEPEEDDNFLGFTEDELAEMAMHEVDLPDLDEDGPKEDSGFLPRTPRLSQADDNPSPANPFNNDRPITSTFAAAPDSASHAAPRAPQQSRSGSAPPPTQHHAPPNPQGHPPVQRTYNPGLAQRTLDGILDELKREIPAFVSADLVQAEDGTALAGVTNPSESVDRELAVAYYGDVMRNALRAARAFGEDAPIDTVQITTDAHYILGRFVPDTTYAQLVTLKRDGNLGIALVVMRRFDEDLAHLLHAS